MQVATGKARGFRDLEVWQLSRELTKEVYRLTKSFPEEEKFLQISQLRRASISIMANIAEGWGRRSKASFTHFLDTAAGSLYEVYSPFFAALDQEYVSEVEFSEVESKIDELGRKLYNFISRLRPDVVREELAEYDAT